MVGLKTLLASVMIVMTVSFGGQWAAAQVHHVVGGDRGWDSSLDVDSWSAGRVFRVGDKIWLAYSAAQESIAELRSKEEYETCDVRDPIRMYSDGLDVIPLEVEGIRYFVSSKNDNCKKGLKLHVDVMPHHHQSPGTATVTTTSEGSAFLFADPPTSPSDSARFGATLVLVFVGVVLYMVSF